MESNLNGEFSTDDTKLAAYLIQDGFSLLRIEYVKKQYGKITGVFLFDIATDDPLLIAAKNKYDFGEAYPNLDRYERVKDTLIDRIKRGLP